MRLRGKVEYRVGLELREGGIHRLLVADVLHEQLVLPLDFPKRLDVARISELVHDEDVASLAAEMADERGADEPAASRYDAAAAIPHLQAPRG